MSKAPPLRVGALLRAHVEGHNEPASFLPIESTTPMNAGSGVALVVYRGPDDAQVARLFANAPDMLDALRRIGALSPYSDEVNDAQAIARAAIAKATDK
jgi:hypothetical protein